MCEKGNEVYGLFMEKDCRELAKDRELRDLFHKAWGQATMSNLYDKTVWVDLVYALSRHGVIV